MEWTGSAGHKESSSVELVAQLGLNALWHGTLNVTEVWKDVASPWRVHDVREKAGAGMMIGSGVGMHT